MRALHLTPVALALAACVAPAAAPRGGQARSGEQSVTVGAEAFVARVAPDAPGLMLTAQGARPVQGQAVAVMRASGRMAFDEGALAKKAAREGCRALGGRFDEMAIGGYQDAGAWLFRGACA